MILWAEKLQILCKTNELVTPFVEENIWAVSIDLILWNQFCIQSNDLLDIKKQPLWKTITVEDWDSLTLKPWEFILGVTKEFLKIPKEYCAFVHGKSSIWRTWLQIHNAGLIQPWFQGTITLEIQNQNNVPVKIYPWIKICQISLEAIDWDIINSYNGKYQNQKDVTESRLHTEY